MLTNFRKAFMALTLLTAVQNLHAQSSIRNYSLIYSENLKGGCAMIGNTSMHIISTQGAAAGTVNLTKMNEIGNPSNGRGGIGYTQYGNNNENMQFVKIDNSTAGIFNASSSDLILPAGINTIKFARLYWGGLITTAAVTSSPDTMRKVKIRKGTSGAYTDVITAASNVDVYNYTTTEKIYQSYVDVTNFINLKGAGTFTVANIPSSPGTRSGGSFAGWSLVVAYENTALNYNSIRIYDGYTQIYNVGSGPVTQTVNLTGLNVPNNPLTADEAVMQVMAWEGDGQLGVTNFNPAGDYLQVNGVSVSNATNISNNFWNSSITKNGAYVTTKNPNYFNQMGIDIDEVSVGVGYGIQPNATGVTIKFGTESDQYFPSVFTFSIKMKPPTVSLDKSVSDSSGNGFIESNELLTYTLTGSNTGVGSAYNARVVDSLPLNVSYISGSLQVVSAPGITAGIKTDAQDNDIAFVGIAANGRKYVVFNIGTGATSTAGGIIPSNGSYSLKLQVRAEAIPGSVINTARIISSSQAGDVFTDDGTAIIGASAGPLPVKLTDFNALKVSAGALVNWSTEQEENSAYFEVQRSTDGVHFTNRTIVNAAGHSSSRINYSYTDNLNGINGIVYYRLRMVDKDGRFSLSKVIALKLNGAMNTETISVFPNPFVDYVKVSLNASYDVLAKIRIIGMNGTVVAMRNVPIQKGNNIIILDEFRKMSRGTYVVELIAGEETYSRKVNKQ